MALLFALFGPPGSGKGTQAELLCKRLGLSHLSTGDLLREERRLGTPLGMKAGELISRGQLVSDQIVGQMVRNQVTRLTKEGKGVLFDGYPRNLAQLRQLDGLLQELNCSLQFGVSLVVADEKIIERLSSRRVCEKCRKVYNLLFNPPTDEKICDNCGGRLYQRNDDRREAIAIRLKDYHSQTAPVIRDLEERGKIAQIPGDRPIEAVHADLMRLIADRTGVVPPLAGG